MKINYILLCSGGITNHTINHALLNAATPAEAAASGTLIIEKLYASGYRRFHLFDVTDDGAHKEIGRYIYEAVEPIINFEPRGN